MAVEVTADGPGGRTHRYILGSADDPDVQRRRWPPPLILADGTPDHDMLDAMAEVDALTPSCPPISPGIHNQMGPWPEPPPLRDVPAWSRIDRRPPPPEPMPRAKPEPPPCRTVKGG